MSRTVSGWLRTTTATGTSRSASAMAAVRSPVAAVGRTSTIIASTSSSAASSSRHCRKSAPETAAVVSTGPLTVPPGSRARSLRLVWPAGWWTASPRSAEAAAVSTPAPPTLDTIATVPPAGTGWVASSAVTSVSSPRPGVAMMPACANSASRLTSGVATAAVCEAAARWPAAERPACTVNYSANSWSTGFTASITITNNGPAFTAWTLGYSYTGNQALAQGWSGNWPQSGKNVTVTNASWNGSLATGASTQIGANFSYSGTNTAPTVFTINGTTCTGPVAAQPAPTVSITSPLGGAIFTPGSAPSLAAP